MQLKQYIIQSMKNKHLQLIAVDLALSPLNALNWERPERSLQTYRSYWSEDLHPMVKDCLAFQDVKLQLKAVLEAVGLVLLNNATCTKGTIFVASFPLRVAPQLHLHGIPWGPHPSKSRTLGDKLP